MSQVFVPAAFYRGGTSKGLFLHARDCPADPAARDAMLLSALGSPDPYGRQLDGMGGGTSSLSKAAIIGPPTRPDADVDYTFAQIAVAQPVVDWGANCGNLASAVGPFAVDEGMVAMQGDSALLRIHQVNTGKIIHARFPLKDGRAAVDGDFAIDGVAGTGARIGLEFLEPAGTFTSGLLPSGRVLDVIADEAGPVPASLVDATNPVVFVAASDLGLRGGETPDEIEADPALMARLDRLRRAAGVMMGMAPTPEAVGLANPKIAVVSAPAGFRALDGREFGAESHDIAVRMVSMERVHRAVTLTGAMCLAAACRIGDSLPNRLCRAGDTGGPVRIAHASGFIETGARVAKDGGWHVAGTTVYRTARRLMQGAVAVRPFAGEGA